MIPRDPATPPLWVARAGLAALLVFGVVSGLAQGAGLLLGATGWWAALVWVMAVGLGYLASRALLRAIWSRR